MKLTLEPLRRAKLVQTKPISWIIRDEAGEHRGMVRKRPKGFDLNASGKVHTLFPGATAVKSFKTLKEVRAFLADRPEQWWKASLT